MGNHINGLEGFWGYLKRKLASKGGIRREKLPLYLGEYVWRYNHRKESDMMKVRRILKMLEQEVSGQIVTIPAVYREGADGRVIVSTSLSIL
jgi:hypothetical protein